MPNASYFLGSRLLGSCRIPDKAGIAYSTAFFCRTCGNLWGRVLVEGSDWRVVEVPCENHTPTGVPDWSTVPGSFLVNSLEASHTSRMFWGQVIDWMPQNILQREVLLALRYFNLPI